MLETDLLGRNEAQFSALAGPKLLVLYSYRYDAHLVPALRENLAGLADGFVAWDDRPAAEIYTSETERRYRLLAEARRLGADWILAMDPDERLEPAATPALRALMARGRPVLPVFNLREMFAPDAWRSDGLWGMKTLIRMVPLSPATRFGFDNLHSNWRPAAPKLATVDTGLNLYHLKMLDPARRQARRELYASLDPGRKYQAAGYDYLTEEAGLTLEKVPPGRMFTPTHHDDGALWMPVAKASQPDRPENRLLLAASLARRGKTDDARNALSGLPALLKQWKMAPAEQGRWLLRAGLTAEAANAFRAALKRRPASAEAWDGLLEALGQGGAWDEHAKALAPLEVAKLQGDEITLLRLQPRLGQSIGTTAFASQGWSAGAVQVRWGRQAPVAAAMAVVVIGHNGQTGLAAAVDSLLEQKPQPLVIAVNSGEGDLAELLGNRLARLVAVSIPEPVFVGAARNIGAALTLAPWVAFLAGDCTADPGWVAARLTAHQAGALTVSTPVLAPADAGPVAQAAHAYLFSARLPSTPDKRRGHFGLSYARCLLPAHGWFDAALRVSEDSRLNEALRRFLQPAYAAGAKTRHAGPETLPGAMADIAKRRRLLVRFQPASALLPLSASAAQVIVTSVALAFRREGRALISAQEALGAGPDRPGPVMTATLHLLRPAAIFGRLQDLARDLGERRRARRVAAACRAGNPAGAARLFSPPPHLNALPATDLAAALESAGLSDLAISLLEHTARFTFTDAAGQEHQAALETALARLKSSLPQAGALTQTDPKAT